jgi:Tol biopolymer transport system component
MTLAPGDRLGCYEVLAPLGKGGMGEVYRATDTKLKRDVALKLLPEAFIEDLERLARFEREAQLLAQLHHPHIASIFGLEESEGTRALVMELVDGPTLADRLESGSLSIDESLSIAHQIAEALETAHEKGIVHRDLKPQNIKASIEGKVKVLDFGLAKAMDVGSGVSSVQDLARSPTLMNSPTLTAAGTQLGVILGTAAYMAPEQARGGAVDKRADIWAFGVVLFEMLTGRSLFSADTVSDTLAGVLKSEIDLGRLPESTPPAIRRLLRRCLERNPKNRLHDVADARIVLDEVASGRVEEGIAAAPRVGETKRAAWPLVAAALVLGLALGAVAAKWLWAPGAGSQNSLLHRELEITPPHGLQMVSGLALSADGLQLAFVARGDDGRTALWVRDLSTERATLIPGTTDARFPFWSPDGRRLGFFAQNRLKVTDLIGGNARTLAETGATVDARGGTWNDAGRILYAPTFLGPIWSVAAEGGEPEPATRIPEGSDVGTQRFPSFLPDGQRFLFYASSGTGVEPGEIYLGRLGSLDSKRLCPANSGAFFAPPSYLLYVRGDTLVAHRFDEAREELDGEPIPLGITLPGSVSISGQRSLGVSREGTLVYRADKRNATALVWVNRRGEEVGRIGSDTEAWHYGARLSPDGRMLAVSRYERGSTSGGIWIHDLERGAAFPVTFGETSDDTLAVWSPDGHEIAFAGVGEAGNAISRVDIRRPESARTWIRTEGFAIPVAWLPDGGLLYIEGDPAGTFSLWRVDSAGGERRRLSPERGSETNVVLSPDGRWLAFGSNATRRQEVYLRRLDDTTGATTVRVSSEGGDAPRWRGDGRELYFVDDAGRLMAVPVELGELPRIGRATPLFAGRLEEASDTQYDVAQGGERFILNRSLLEDRVPVEVVLGWPARLGRAAPR